MGEGLETKLEEQTDGTASSENDVCTLRAWRLGASGMNASPGTAAYASTSITFGTMFNFL